MAFENFYYVIYLLVVLFSALLIVAVARLKINYRKAFIAILPVFIIFVLWDIFAVWRGHWAFGHDKMLGPLLINQPLDELAFFIVVPLFHIIAWEAIKKFRKVAK